MITAQVPFSTHRLSFAQAIDTLTNGGPESKQALLQELSWMNPDDPRFAIVSQRLTEVREQLRKLEKLLEQENEFAMMRMKSMEKNNEAVYR